LADTTGLVGPRQGARHFQVRINGRIFQWEQHGEFVAYTFELAPGAPPAWPADLSQPGPLLVAIKLDIGAADDATPPSQDEIVTSLAHGRALAASNFRPAEDGYVPIRVMDRGLAPGEAGPLAQRILEVETYRVLALLGLPEAHRQMPFLSRIEAELPKLIEAIRAGGNFGESQRLLDQLSEMSADLEAASAASVFRFGATRAYSELMRLRLDALAEVAVGEGQTWAAFFARRLNPALRTCIAAEDRQAALSRKLTRAAQLLRTRVEVGLQSQNRDLLEAMNRRALLQLRLQRTVEGLSVAAISYYLASLLHLALEGAHAVWPGLNATVATALAVPVVVLCVWRVVAQIRLRHTDQE
jgi:uncharacterized membrane-anchored protein